MDLSLSLKEVLEQCSDWLYFCDEEGWDVYCVNEGGGDIEVSLSYEQSKKYGLI